MRIGRIYSRASIKYKILVLLWLTIFLLSFSLSIYSYTVSKRSIQDQITASNRELVNQVNSSILFIRSDVKELMTLISIDTNALNLLGNAQKLPATDSIFETQRFSSLQTIINILVSKRYISRIILYANTFDQPITFSDRDNSSDVRPFSVVYASEEYRRTYDAGGQVTWFTLESDNSFYRAHDEDTQIVAAKLVKDLHTQEPLGLLVVGISEPLFRQAYTQRTLSDGEGLTVINRQGDEVSAGGFDLFDSLREQGIEPLGLLDRQTALCDTGAGRYYITSLRNPDSGLHVLYGMPYDRLTGELNSIKWFTVFMILLSLALSIPVTMLIFKPIASSIHALTLSMQKFRQGDLNTRIVVHYEDELGELAKGYNAMIEEVQTSIEQVYMSQIREREAELKALEAQINPHFLYNTLEIMLTKAETSKNQDIADMIYSLAKLFRLTLNRGNSETTVANEKELIEHYLLLQKRRYKDRLEYRVDIEERLLPLPIPKQIIQPFVENSIIHGIEKKTEGGRVEVRGYADGGDVVFRVSDNGGGMEREEYDRLHYSLEHDVPYETSHGGYALRNVKERLRLAYRGGYRLDIRTSPGEGYEVTIRLTDGVGRIPPC